MDPLDDAVIPSEYPQLVLLAWNRDVTRPMRAEDAFRLYERNWRHVDEIGMTIQERKLVADLAERFGHGVVPT